MNIFVFVTLLSDPAEYDPDNLDSVTVTPFDLAAIQEAIRLKQDSEDSVTVAFVGPAHLDPVIRKLISADVDEAVHLKVDDDIFEKADAFTIATALGNFLNDKEHDLILFGKQQESLVAGLPHITAELLNIPCVTSCKSFDLNEEELSIYRSSDNSTEKVLTSLPCVIELEKESIIPFKTSLLRLLKSQFRRVSTEQASVGDPKIELLKLESRPQRKQKFFTREQIHDLIKTLKEEEKVI